MSKKLVHDVALIATKLHEAGLTFEDAELAAQYCSAESLRWGGFDVSRRVADSPVDTLWWGFTWSETPEGYDYWRERANLLDGVDYEH